MSSLANHLNEKTKSKKMGLGGVLTKEKDVANNDYMDINNVRM
jgi:hypothetical protein